ncbi:molybdopterin-binding protein [Flavobacterium chungangense]|uniref:molybdopterin-binding protein n=1 Tax=Flavobacterium chungangense TaxID=554283 RepID=UPI001ADF4A5E|nr:molybdopterin-binding protein [Flavobacterium chungangense]
MEKSVFIELANNQEKSKCQLVFIGKELEMKTIERILKPAILKIDKTKMKKIKIRILTVSDPASKDVYEDLSGEEIRKVVDNYTFDNCDFRYCLVPDEGDLILEKLIVLSDDENYSLIFTTGVKGPALRDIRPEATEKACQKMLSVLAN